jgi:hypothetical protein
MRTRIAQDADGASTASDHTRTRRILGSARAALGRALGMRRRGLVAPAIAGGGALIAAAVLAAAGVGPTTAGAEHRIQGAHHRHAATLMSHELAVRARVLMDMRWLTAWKAAHPVAAPAPVPPPPPPAPPVVITDATSTTTADWACIRLHESGDRFNSPTAPGGAYGFLEETWLSLGYSGWPYEASPWVQSQAALFLYNELGWQPWSTRFVCGL